MFYIPGTNRFYALLLSLFWKFDFIGKNVIIEPSCEIRKRAASYIHLGNRVSLGKDVWLNIPYEASANSSRLTDICLRIYDKYLDGSVVSHEKALRHLRINRYLCLLDQKINKRAGSGELGCFKLRTELLQNQGKANWTLTR
jgi:hypothetical protein